MRPSQCAICWKSEWSKTPEPPPRCVFLSSAQFGNTATVRKCIKDVLSLPVHIGVCVCFLCSRQKGLDLQYVCVLYCPLLWERKGMKVKRREDTQRPFFVPIWPLTEHTERHMYQDSVCNLNPPYLIQRGLVSDAFCLQICAFKALQSVCLCLICAGCSRCISYHNQQCNFGL